MNEQQQQQGAAQDLIPAGNCDAVCTGEVQYGESSKGTEQIGVGLEIGGHLATAILYFSAEATQYSIPKLKACGWSGSGDIGPQIKGKRCRVSVKYENYTNPETGETSRNMKINIFDGNGGMKFEKPMDEQRKSRFLTSLAQKAAGSGAPQQVGGYPPSWDQSGPGPAATAPQQPQAPTGRFSLGGK